MDLLERARGGDQQAFEAIVRPVIQPAYRVARTSNLIYIHVPGGGGATQAGWLSRNARVTAANSGELPRL